jgi:hypothetical protein
MAHAHSPKSRKLSSLYERDLYAWVEEQVGLLRSGRLDELDALNVAEELSDVGSNEYDKLESALRVLLAHMLKWDHQPTKRSRSWENSILEHRHRAERQLRKNPSLKSKLAEIIEDSFRSSRLEATSETDLDLDQFPEECPSDWDAIMKREFTR